MKKNWIPILAALLFLVHALPGVIPQKWEIRSQDDFLKGTFTGVSVSSEGLLSLSPKEEKMEGPGEEFYLSLLVDPEGTVFLGTGHGGKIFRIGKGEKPEIYYQVPEMDVYCLAQDKKGNLYAGTSPNGKIYKITGKDQGNVFFNPPEKYIWDLFFTKESILLAAVGEDGGIYQINQQGEGKILLGVEENHVLCLTIDKNGDLIAGTGGKGLLYRISPEKKASVVFESPYEEIRSIAVDIRGNIYASAGGIESQVKKQEVTTGSGESNTDITITVTPSTLDLRKGSSLKHKRPSVLYRINPEGMTKELWRSGEELIYSLLWNEEEKKLVFGTGDNGRIYSIDKDEKISLLLQKESEQIYLLLPHGMKVYALSNNPSYLSVIYPEQRFDGEYLSKIFDSKMLSSWGRIEWNADLPSETTLQFQTRSGNSSKPNKSWSDWSPPYSKKEGEPILSPKARYVQLKAIFKTQSGKTSPLLHEISFFYLQTNIAPRITRLRPLPSSEVYLKPLVQTEIIWGADKDFSEETKRKDKIGSLAIPKKVVRKGFQTLVWEATDENGDDLTYSLYIKGKEDSQWRLLKEQWNETIYAFSTFSFPDGIYVIKVRASDSPTNPLGSELKAEKISRPLIIDNTPPRVINFQATREDSKLNLTFSTEDLFSHIKEVKYFIKPDKWRTVFPVDGICDSKAENFKLTLSLTSKSGNLISIKVKDGRHNIGVHNHTF